MDIIKKNSMMILLFFVLTASAPIIAGSFLLPLTDSVNSGIINTEIFTDHSLSNININATVNHGIAIFSGEVNSQAEINELVRIAHSVSGIYGVDIAKVKIRAPH